MTGLTHDSLGNGGSNLVRHQRAVNEVDFATAEGYESLLKNSAGNFLSDSRIDEFRSSLFPKINGIALTIGRVPTLDEFLPGGARHVISANGVTTDHAIDITKGQNQAYVRCFDIVLDVDAELNYGKTHIVDGYLVRRVNRFLNEAYAATIQNAAETWVGKIATSVPDPDIFLSRADVGIADLASRKIPNDENDVIGLFFELLGKGTLQGYQIFGLSQRDRYDCRALIARGSGALPPVPMTDAQLEIVEFKLHASLIVRDIEAEEKNSAEVKLIIAWDEGNITSPRFAFDDQGASHYRAGDIFPGVTRVFFDSNNGAEVQVLLLKSVIEGMSNSSN